jgi:hypothetical protein
MTSAKPIHSFGPSTMPVTERPGALLLHIQANLQMLVDRSQ